MSLLQEQNPSPSDFESLERDGVFAAQQKDFQRACELLNKAHMLRPNAQNTLLNLSKVLFEMGQHEQTILALEKLIAMRPNHSEGLFYLGLSYREIKDFKLAFLYLKDAALNSPSDKNIWYELGVTQQTNHQYDLALDSFKRATDCDPKDPFIINEIGRTYYAKGDFQSALSCYENAIKNDENLVSSCFNFALTLQSIGDYNQAIRIYNKVLELNTDYFQAYHNKGDALEKLDRLEEALDCFNQALKINPNYSDSQLSAALLYLLYGEYQKGWSFFEARKAQNFASHFYDEAVPNWTGTESLNDRTILLLAEQGFGDTIQFCRYALSVKSLGARVVLVVDPSLRNLFRHSFVPYGVEVAEDGVSYRAHFQCYLLSLPLALGTFTEKQIPCQVPYLYAESAHEQIWQKRLKSRFDGVLAIQPLLVGLVWAGGYRPENIRSSQIDQRRSMPFAKFAGLISDLPQLKRVQFFSLQKGIPATQLSSEHGVVDWTDEFFDWADTAAFIANLDLVISVDTAVAHLAGAMGKPVWLLSRFNGCWRWLEDRTDSPWYPTMRIFRQPKLGDWDSVIEQVKLALQDLASSPQAHGR
jgi:tetratricopeptide (TPR) repeat protein